MARLGRTEPDTKPDTPPDRTGQNRTRPQPSDPGQNRTYPFGGVRVSGQSEMSGQACPGHVRATVEKRKQTSKISHISEIGSQWHRVGVKLGHARQWFLYLPPSEHAEFYARRDAGAIVTAQRRIKGGWELVAARVPSPTLGRQPVHMRQLRGR